MLLNPKLAREVSDYVNKRVSILDVLQKSGLKLNSCGGIWKAFCPFHKDKDSPSFVVKQELNYVHCFGCNSTWFPVKFVMEYEHKTWAEAIQYLAQVFSLNLSAFEREPTGNDKLILQAKEVNRAAAEWMHKQIANNSRAQQYLLSRYDQESIEKWQLGYCSKGEKLIEFLLKKCKFDYSLIQKVDIRPFMFNDRIIYPIFDMYGEIVGFSCRIWALSKQEEEEKYQRDKKNGYYRKFVNTSAKSILFKYKSSNLYGLNYARKSLAKNKGTLILVEGCSDVILMHKHGFENCVGVLSCSFNKHTMTALADVSTKKVIFCLDGDGTGQKRTLDILTAQKKGNIDIPDEAANIFYTAVSIPNGEDPDEFLASEANVDIMGKMLNQPMSLPEFYIHCKQKEKGTPPQSLTEKLEYILDIKKNLSPCLSRAETAIVMKHLQETVGISAIEYHDYVSIKKPVAVSKPEEYMLALLAQDKFFRKSYIDIEIFPEMFSRGYASLFNIIKNLHGIEEQTGNIITPEQIVKLAKERHVVVFFGNEKRLLDIITKTIPEDVAVLNNFMAHVKQKQLKKFATELNNFINQNSADEAINFIKETLISLEKK